MSGTRVVLEGPGKFHYGAPDLRTEWKRWKRGFNSWLIGSEQDAKKEVVKVNLLLTFMGSDGQDIHETFDFTEEQPSLAQVLERFDSHFAGLSNVTIARFRFFSFVQGSASVTEFLTGLKSLANDCEFGDLRDSLVSLVKDMMVIHCSSEKLRERLLKEPKLVLTKAVEIARIGDVEVITRTTDGGTAGALVAGKRGTLPRGGDGFRRPWKFDGNCFECGELLHMAKDCPNRDDDGSRRQARNRNCSSTSNDRDGDRKTYAGYAAGWALGARMKGEGRGRWYVDSGASELRAHDARSIIFRLVRTIPEAPQDRSWRREHCPCVREGETEMTARAAAGKALVSLKRVQYVPKLQMSLLSVPATTRMGNEVAFQRKRCVVSCGSFRLMCPISDGGLYEEPTLSGSGGDREVSATGCATSGSVKMKPVHQHVQPNERPEGYGYGSERTSFDGTCSRMAGYPGIKTTTGGASRRQDPADSRTMDEWKPRFLDSRIETGGQGYPGASTRNGSTAGGQGYPGASSRIGMC